MRHVGLLAFSITTCLLVPAAVHQLIAGKEQLAKLSAPDAGSITLPTARVAVSLDKYMLDTGDTVTVRLAATEVTSAKLELGVLVMGSNGSEESRVPSPPVGVAYKTIKLDVDGTTASGEIAIPLKGATQGPYNPFGHYTVLVGPPAQLAKLERYRSRSGYVETKYDDGIPSLNKSGEKFMQMYYLITAPTDGEPQELSAEEKQLYTPGTIARLEAHTRPKSTALAISMPDTAPQASGFEVRVKVTNPSRRAMKGLQVSLTENKGVHPDFEDAPTNLTITDGLQAVDLAPRETKELAFRVQSPTAGVFGVFARAQCPYDDAKAASCTDVQALQLGAFDAIEIREAAPVVGHAATGAR